MYFFNSYLLFTRTKIFPLPAVGQEEKGDIWIVEIAISWITVAHTINYVLLTKREAIEQSNTLLISNFRAANY